MAWYDEVNAIWKQVGQDIGAEFEFLEPAIGKLDSGICEGSLVKKFGESVIRLEYHAYRDELPGPAAVDVGTYTQMDARVGSDPSFSFEIGRHRPWRGRTVDILNNRYRIKSNDEEKARELLDDSKIRRSLVDALPYIGLNPLRRSQLILKHRMLRFIEDSNTDIHGHSGIMASLAEDWRVPISNPYRIMALFQLFKAVLDRLPPPPVSPLPTTPVSLLPTIPGEEKERRRMTLLPHRFASRSTYYSGGRVINLDPEGWRLVFQALYPPLMREMVREDDSDWEKLCFVPDPRLSQDWAGLDKSRIEELEIENLDDALDFGGIYFYSVRVKEFPVFGRIRGVRWEAGRGEEEVAKALAPFSKHVIDMLNENSQLEQIIKEEKIDLCVTSLGIWVISTIVPTLKPSVRECFKIIAEALLSYQF